MTNTIEFVKIKCREKQWSLNIFCGLRSTCHVLLKSPPCCYHKGQIVNSTMFDKGRLTLILFFQLNLSYINKPFRKMPKNSNFLIRLETGCTDCLLQVYTKENKRKVTWYGQQNLSLVNTIE